MQKIIYDSSMNWTIKIREAIDNRDSFEVVGVAKSEMYSVCEHLENYIESLHLTCRVYTQKRVVSAMAGLFNPVAGVIAAATIAAHNILTYNPDYEIGRDLANNRICVDYKKNS